MIKAMNHNIHPLNLIFSIKVRYGHNKEFLQSGMHFKVRRVLGGKQKPYVGVPKPW